MAFTSHALGRVPVHSTCMLHCVMAAGGLATVEGEGGAMHLPRLVQGKLGLPATADAYDGHRSVHGYG